MCLLHDDLVACVAQSGLSEKVRKGMFESQIKSTLLTSLLLSWEGTGCVQGFWLEAFRPSACHSCCCWANQSVNIIARRDGPLPIWPSLLMLSISSRVCCRKRVCWHEISLDALFLAWAKKRMIVCVARFFPPHYQMLWYRLLTFHPTSTLFGEIKIVTQVPSRRAQDLHSAWEVLSDLKARHATAIHILMTLQDKYQGTQGRCWALGTR